MNANAIRFQVGENTELVSGSIITTAELKSILANHEAQVLANGRLGPQSSQEIIPCLEDEDRYQVCLDTWADSDVVNGGSTGGYSVAFRFVSDDPNEWIEVCLKDPKVRVSGHRGAWLPSYA